MDIEKGQFKGSAHAQAHPARTFIYGIRLAGVSLELKILNSLRILLPQMKDDLLANGFSQWVFSTANPARLRMTLGLGLFLGLVWFISRRKSGNSWFPSVLFWSGISWTYWWLLSPYLMKFSFWPKFLLVLAPLICALLLVVPGNLLKGQPVLPLFSAALGLGIVGVISIGMTPFKPFVINRKPPVSEAIPTTPTITPSLPTPSPSPTLSNPTPTSSPIPSVYPVADTEIPPPCPDLNIPIPRHSNYRVRPGDCLSCIGQRAGVYVKDLLYANPGIKDPHFIISGQLLYIP